MITTAGVACNTKGQYFVGKRRASQSLDPCWEFPGGKVETDESPEEALAREFKEEFGVDIDVGTLLCTGKFTNHSTVYHLMAFRIDINGRPECREHSEIDWKNLEELQKLTFAPSDKIILETLSHAAP